MTLSVVVTSYESEDSLAECLESLTAQPAHQIIVADCSTRDPALRLRERFPTVEFRHFDDIKTMPELRWSVLDELTGDVVGALEARAIPEPEWCAKMLAAHAEFPDADIVGGPIAHCIGAPNIEAALYFAEYSEYAPDAEGRSAGLNEANFSIKRRTLTRFREFLLSGEWEHFLRDQVEFRVGDAQVRFCHAGIPFARICGQRFHYGRNYAASRAEREGGVRTLLHAAGSVALPAVLTYRDWRATRNKPVGRQLSRAMPWLVMLNSLWAAGELLGYVAGHTPRKHIY